MAIKDGEHIDGAIEKIKSLASDGTEKEHELNATYFHGKELSSFITAEGGGSTAGVISSSYASGSWITSAKKAALTCEWSTYGGIFSAPTKSGRVSLATYPADTDYVYLNYFTADQISAGTNSANTQLYWDAPNNALHATTFVGSLSGDATAASYVYDYNATTSPIYIGYTGSSLTSCEYLAAYGTTSSGARCIKDISPSSVSVGYATSAGNSDTVDAYHATAAGAWGNIPTINYDDGVMEIGHYLDFHANRSGRDGGNDFDGRIRGDAGGGELVIPSKSGTIAITSDIPTKTSQLTNDSGYKTTDYNYYPTRKYSSGFQLTDYVGSLDCKLYIPVATWTSQGVYVAPYSDSITVSLAYGSSGVLSSCSWTSMGSVAGYKLRITADHGGTSAGALSQVTELIWFKITSNMYDDRWYRVDLGSASYKILSAQATPIKSNLTGYGVGVVTNCAYSSSRYCYIGMDELNSCSGIDVLLIVRYGS